MGGMRRRTTLFIARRFQIRYITLILLMMFAVVGVTGYTVYVTTWIMFGEKLAAVYPQGLLLDIVKQVNAVLVMRLLFLVPLVLFVGLVLSNRIAGPIYRIKRYLSKVAGGAYSGQLKLRHKDELQDLAEVINQLADKLDSDRKSRMEKIGHMDKVIEKLDRGEIPPAEAADVLRSQLKTFRE
ncbi:MAG: HAMP domain-containing protein [Candidatus Omnitrophica bacterium]|nr:HAMP domain-containing protein [Candidatus Omnitrophota bacterium]